MAKQTKAQTKKPANVVPDVDDFMSDAKPLTVDLGGQKLIAAQKQFQTGSFGWHGNGKVMMPVGDDGLMLPCQVNIIVTVIGSKP